MENIIRNLHIVDTGYPLLNRLAITKTHITCHF